MERLVDRVNVVVGAGLAKQAGFKPRRNSRNKINVIFSKREQKDSVAIELEELLLLGVVSRHVTRCLKHQEVSDTPHKHLTSCATRYF